MVDGRRSGIGHVKSNSVDETTRKQNTFILTFIVQVTYNDDLITDNTDTFMTFAVNSHKWRNWGSSMGLGPPFFLGEPAPLTFNFRILPK